MIPTYLKPSFVKTTAITHKDFYQFICKIVGIMMKLIELNTVKKIISLEKVYAVCVNLIFRKFLLTGSLSSSAWEKYQFLYFLALYVKDNFKNIDYTTCQITQLLLSKYI